MIGFDVDIIEVPIAQTTAIVSAVKSPTTDKLYLGLTSKGDVLVEYDPKTGEFRGMNVHFKHKAAAGGTEEQRSDKIHNSLCMTDNGIIYAGQFKSFDYPQDSQLVDSRTVGGGRILRIDPEKDEIKDLGELTPMGGIHGMAIDSKGRWAYCYVLPDNHFYRFDLQTGEVTDFGQISKEQAAHHVVATEDGNAYIAHCVYARYQFYKHIYLCKYDRKADKFIRWCDDDHMLSWALAPRIAGNSGVDIFERTASGLIYGGMAFEGKIFTIDPATDKVTFLGAPPVMGPGLRCLKEAPDGMIYGTAGYPRAEVFSYNPKTRVFNNHGTPNPSRKKMLYFHAMAIDADGCVYVGETDAGKCILYKLTPK
ncbi:MAG: hypothetical protein J7M14_02180 [Planctomycetes bacterium]|nr:hypothetical protein [Planctomycetota bacterium]